MLYIYFLFETSSRARSPACLINGVNRFDVDQLRKRSDFCEMIRQQRKSFTLFCVCFARKSSRSEKFTFCVDFDAKFALENDDAAAFAELKETLIAKLRLIQIKRNFGRVFEIN